MCFLILRNICHVNFWWSIILLWTEDPEMIIFQLFCVSFTCEWGSNLDSKKVLWSLYHQHDIKLLDHNCVCPLCVLLKHSTSCQPQTSKQTDFIPIWCKLRLRETCADRHQLDCGVVMSKSWHILTPIRLWGITGTLILKYLTINFHSVYKILNSI